MMLPMRLMAMRVVVLALLALIGTADAAAQGRQPLGAYPPGMPGGQIPLGAYPSNQPPSLPEPAGPPAVPPAMADDRAGYCARNPAVCQVREPEFHDYAVDRQKAFERRMRDLELEIERGRATRP